jgi:uncharacterized phage protein gp47/JayE
MANTVFTFEARSYDEIVAQFNQQLAALVPEIALEEGDPLYAYTLVMAGALANMHLYSDNAARESYTASARLFKSIAMLAQSEDYRIQAGVPMQAVLTFALSDVAPSDILIPAGTVVTTQDGVPYTTLTNATILLGATNTTVVAAQRELFTAQIVGTTDGTASQVIPMPDGLADNSAVLTIGAELYTPVDTFFESSPNSTHYIHRVNSFGNNEIVLGDGVNGKKPATGQTITADYAITEGAAGYARTDTITEIVSTITLPPTLDITCTNANPSSGGRDRQDIESVRRGITSQIRTAYTAVSLETYVALGYKVAGVEKVGIDYQFGTTVSVFVLPSGGGIATPALLATVKTYYEERCMILTKIATFPAGEVRLRFTANVVLANNAVRAVVEQGIIDALTSFGSVANQDIGGRVYTSSLVSLIESVEGVTAHTIADFVIVPYARPDGSTPALAWSVEMLAGCTATVTWQIVFTTATTFQLYKQNVLALNGTTGVQFTYNNEVRATIAGTYAAGNRWTFNTYAYVGNQVGFYQLEEPSLPRIYEEDITINMTGGI